MAQHSKLACAVYIAVAFMFPASLQAKKLKPPAKSDANDLILKRNYKSAFLTLQNRANAGENGAQYKLAQLYRIGLGTNKDSDAAICWLEKASAAGNRKAENLLGRLKKASPPTVKRIASSGAVSTGPDAVNFASLPARTQGRPDWLTIAVARKSKVAIESLVNDNTATDSKNAGLALATATKNNDSETVEKLLKANVSAQSDANNPTPLMIALTMSSDELTNLLLDKSPALGMANSDTISLATKTCQPNIVTKLLGSATQTNSNLNASLIAKNCNNWQDFKGLLEGSDLNTKDSSGRTAASYAAEKGDTPLLAWLAKSGANLSQADGDGLSPLHIASLHKQAFSVRYLMSVVSNINAANSRDIPPLMFAAYAGCTDCLSSFLETSDQLDAKNNDGDTSLIFAIRGQQTAVATTLVERGANLNAQNIAGDTPAKLAERLGFPLLKGTSP